MPIDRASFNQQNPMPATSSQLVSKGAARGARPDNDIVGLGKIGSI